MVDHVLFEHEKFDEAAIEQAYQEDLEPHRKVVFARFQHEHFSDRFSEFRYAVANALNDMIKVLENESNLLMFLSSSLYDVNVDYIKQFCKFKEKELAPFGIRGQNGKMIYRYDDHRLYAELQKLLTRLDRPKASSRYKKQLAKLDAVLTDYPQGYMPCLLTDDIKRRLIEMRRINEEKIRESELYKENATLKVENVELKAENDELKAAHEKLQKEHQELDANYARLSEESASTMEQVVEDRVQLMVEFSRVEEAYKKQIEALKNEVEKRKLFGEQMQAMLVDSLKSATEALQPPELQPQPSVAQLQDDASDQLRIQKLEEENKYLQIKVEFFAKQLADAISQPTTPTKSSPNVPKLERQKTPERIAPGSPTGILTTLG